MFENTGSLKPLAAFSYQYIQDIINAIYKKINKIVSRGPIIICSGAIHPAEEPKAPGRYGTIQGVEEEEEGGGV